MNSTTPSILPRKEAPRIPIAKIREIIALRTDYDDDALDELGASMEDQGQLQPVIVQQSEGDDYYELIFGSSRLRSAKRRGHEDIVGFVVNRRSPKELWLMALAENLHRRDLNPFEEANGFLHLTKEFGMSIKDIAKGVNKPPDYVSTRLKLLSMPDAVQGLVAERKLAVGHIERLARVPTADDQVRLAQFAVTHGLSPQELGQETRRQMNEPPPPATSGREPKTFTAYRLQNRLGSFIGWLKAVPSRIDIKHIGPEEKGDVLEVLSGLDKQVRALWAQIADCEVPLSDLPIDAVDEVPSGPQRKYADAVAQVKESGSTLTVASVATAAGVKPFMFRSFLEQNPRFAEQHKIAQ